MPRLVTIILLIGLPFACKNKSENNSTNSDESQKITISKKNIHTIEGAYTMNFADGEQDCTLNHEKIDESFVYQFDKEELQSEHLYCKSNQDLELFCGENETKLDWQGNINKDGQAKLKIGQDLNKDFKNALFEELPQDTSYNSIVLDFNMILDFLQKPQAKGHLQLNYLIPYESKTLSCKTTLPFTLNKEKE